MLLVRNVIFTIIVPGTVTALAPSAMVLSGSMPTRWGTQQYLALLFGMLGVSIYCRCVWDFASVGRCTPMLFDEPKAVIVRGFYRYVRNPMYLGVLLVLLGEAAFFQSVPVLGFTAGVFALFHLVVVFFEEPWLRSTFGGSYQRYCQSVRRWVPGKRYREAA